MAPGLELRFRETATEGRLSSGDVQRAAKRFPQAEFFVCGPGAFVETVTAGLLDGGASPDRIHQERFAPVSYASGKPEYSPAPHASARGSSLRQLLVAFGPLFVAFSAFAVPLALLAEFLSPVPALAWAAAAGLVTIGLSSRRV